MEHQKPISARCDTFPRIWVSQGHINIINEQKADWRNRVTERGCRRRQESDTYLPAGFDGGCLRTAAEWWRDSVRPGISCDYLPLVWKRDKWMAELFFSFFQIHLEKSHLPLVSYTRWQQSRKYTKETSPLIYVTTAIFIWGCSVAVCRA